MIDRETPLAEIVGQMLSRITILDNNICSTICPTILASGVSLSIIMLVPSHAEFFQIYIMYSTTQAEYACLHSYFF